MSTPEPLASPLALTPSAPLSLELQIARKRAILQVTVLENPWIPEEVKAGLTVKQAEWACYEGLEALFGGAAGGGKSIALLIAALQWIEEPGYSALILRRTYKQLAKSDSIMAKAKSWLWGKAHWSGDVYRWTFENGNTLEFGHMEHEDAKLDYQGGSWQFIGVDECTQFNESMLSYPRSRLRRPIGSRIPIRWRGATNPGGPGHDYIKARYVKDRDGNSPCTPDRQFFPAKLADNPNIDREAYVKQLQESGIDPLTLAQLLEGDWDAVPGGRFRRDWFTKRWRRRGDYIQIIDANGRMEYEFLPYSLENWLTIDPAASTKTSADYTVISGFIDSPRGDLIWLGCDRFRAEIPDIVPRIQANMKRMKAKTGGERGRMPSYVGIEAIAANRGVLQIAQRATNPPIPANELNKGDRDKLAHATAAINFASSGKVILPAPGADPAFPLDDVISELVRFTGDDKQDDHDDCVDTLSYGVEYHRDRPQAANSRDALPRVIGG